MTRSLPTVAKAGAILFGVGCLAVFVYAVELLIRHKYLNSFIVPLPSEIFTSFERIVVEEDVPARFLLTTIEALTASVMLTVAGISLGVLLHRMQLVRLATETWIAAMASAPLVLMYPLFLVIFGRSMWTIIMIGFVAALPPVILKTLEGLTGTRQVLINVGRSLVCWNSR